MDFGGGCDGTLRFSSLLLMDCHVCFPIAYILIRIPKRSVHVQLLGCSGSTRSYSINGAIIYRFVCPFEAVGSALKLLPPEMPSTKNRLWILPASFAPHFLEVRSTTSAGKQSTSHDLKINKTRQDQARSDLQKSRTASRQRQICFGAGVKSETTL